MIPTQKISLIVASDPHCVIGREGKLPWGKIRADLKRFKKLTIGKPVIMGRKTFESIGHPLEDRTNIVMTRNLDYHPVGCITAHYMEEALVLTRWADEVMIIGGEDIYNEFYPLANRIYLTVIKHSFEGDAFFDCYKKEEDGGIETSREDNWLRGLFSPYPYSFITLDR